MSMKKIGRIILGWWFLITNRNNELAKKRLKICVSCELRKGMVCGVCFCPLSAKARIPEEQCPHPTELNKWEPSYWERVIQDSAKRSDQHLKDKILKEIDEAVRNNTLL